jgi:hypothetical protein
MTEVNYKRNGRRYQSKGRSQNVYPIHKAASYGYAYEGYCGHKARRWIKRQISKTVRRYYAALDEEDHDYTERYDISATLSAHSFGGRAL